VVDTAAQLAGGIASMAPFMAAAPKAFGLTGTMGQMVKNGAISGAALSGADALTRGESVVPAAGIGGVIGGAAGPVGKGVGKVVSAVADRVRPMAPVPQNIAGSATSKFRCRARKRRKTRRLSANSSYERGGRGVPAQASARLQGFAGRAVNQARDEFSRRAGSDRANASTAPQDAAERSPPN
jgi:hypothetical protein